jgi:hypothetical protein
MIDIDFDIINSNNMELYIRKYSFKYDLCENQRSRLRFYIKELLDKNEQVNTMDLDELTKTKAFVKKLKVVK